MSEDVARAAFSPREFCARNKISKKTFYSLQAKGRGPRIMRDGRLIRISAQAEIDWQKQMETPTTAEHAEAVAQAAEASRERAQLAAQRAARSPRHPANRRRRAR